MKLYFFRLMTLGIAERLKPFLTRRCEIWLRQEAKAQLHSESKELRSRSVEPHLYWEPYLFLIQCFFNLCTCVQISANPDGN